MKRHLPMRVVALSTLSDRPTVWHKRQRFYIHGFQALEDVRFCYEKPIDGVLAYLHDRDWPSAGFFWRPARARDRQRRSQRATHVGRYTLQSPGRDEPLRIAIDVADGRYICDPDAYAWSQIYYKVSYWPSIDYGAKARPLVCGHGTLDDRRIDRLIGLRDQSSRSLDLVLIAKLWPSSIEDPTFWNPVEHLVRVFETLARLRIRSYLRAIVPRLNGIPFPRHYLDRLTKAGVPLIEEIGIDELWNATSQSHLAFLRPGRHLAVSWRMIDHLAMGACTVYDHAPYPVWPVPLQPGREFIDCGCGIGPDETLPAPEEYGRIADVVMTLLSDPERVAASRRAAAAYFDQHVSPPRLAQHLIDTSLAMQGIRGDQLSTRSADRTLERTGARNGIGQARKA